MGLGRASPRVSGQPLGVRVLGFLQSGVTNLIQVSLALQKKKNGEVGPAFFLPPGNAAVCRESCWGKVLGE